MLLRIFSLALIIASTWTQRSKAVLIDFDEFASPTDYTNGQSFIASGVRFESVPLIGTTGIPQNTPIRIGLYNQVGFGNRPHPGTGNVIYPRSALMDFGASIGQQTFVAIPFYNSGGTVNLGINGMSPLVNRGNGTAVFQPFDGQTIDGVTIEVVTLSSSHGRIELSGPIDQVMFGGQETLFDNIFTSNQGPPGPGDFEFDSDVDGRDFLLWQRLRTVGSLVDWQGNYGIAATAANVAVPEPSPLLLGITLIALSATTRLK